MFKLLIIEIALLSLLRSSSAQLVSAGTESAGVIPINRLSSDNPNHKRIIDWFDNYKHKSSQLSSNNHNSDQSLATKPDSIQSIQANQQQSPYKVYDDTVGFVEPPTTIQADDKTFSKYLEQILKANPENDKPILIDRQELDQLLPYAFTQNPTQRQNVHAQNNNNNNNNNNHNNQPLPNIDILFGQRPQPGDQVINPKQLNPNQDAFIQDYIKKLQAQNNDGRTVLVEVSGDDVSEKSILDQIRPLLRDPSVYDRLKPTLEESTSLLDNNNKNLMLELPRAAVNAQPPLLIQKQPVLQADKPLLNQMNKIQELRLSLLDQQGQTYQQSPRAAPIQTEPIPEERRQYLGQQYNTNQQPQTNSQNDYNINALTLTQTLSPNQQQIVLLEQRHNNPENKQIFDQIQQLAFKPLVENQQPAAGQPDQPIRPTHQPHDIRQPLVIGPQTHQPEQRLANPEQKPQYNLENRAQESYMSRNFGQNQQAQPLLINQQQRPQHQQQFQAPQQTYKVNTPAQLAQRHPNLVRGAAAPNVDNNQQPPQHYKVNTPAQVAQHLSFNYPNNAQRGNVAAPAPAPVADNNHQLVRRDQESGRYQLEAQSQQLSPKLDSRQKQQLREQLLRNLEDQERRRQELYDLDLKQRQMIDEERRKQELRDEAEAHRRAVAREEKLGRQAPVQEFAPNRPLAAPESAQHVADNRWHNQESPQTVHIRKQVVDSDRAGPVDVLHSIHAEPAQPTEVPISSATTGTGDSRWNSMESPLVYQQPGQQEVTLGQGGQTGGLRVSKSALDQAEQIDPEYIRRLRDILSGSHSSNQQPVGVPVEAPPTGVALATTHGSVPGVGADVDNTDTNWWRTDKFQSARDHVLRTVAEQNKARS